MENIINGAKLFGLIYIIVIALIYAFSTKFTGTPILIPGDIYIVKAGRKIYIPLGSSLLLTTVVFLVLNSFTK